MQLQRALRRWHRFLGLTPQARSWYADRLREELAERDAAQGILQRLSETADVFYIISRSQHDGYPLRGPPPFRARHVVVYAYLLLKYTSRWAFYRMAARRCSCPDPASVREVVNPAKDDKLRQVAGRHSIHPETFVRACHSLRLLWPLFP